MIFIDENHQKFYTEKIKELKSDVYTKTLIYTLGLTATTRAHFSEIYDMKEREILLDAVNAGWQTSTSIKATRLGFQLYTDTMPTVFCDPHGLRKEQFKKEDIEESQQYSVQEIFCTELAPYFIEALKIRYPRYLPGD